MLLALLLLAHAQAEWVKITQHKPLRTEPNEPNRRVLPSTELARIENSNINHSLERWSQGERLRNRFTEFTTKPNELPPKRRVIQSTEPARTDDRVYVNHSLEKHWSKGVVHRVPNAGNVKRIRLTTEEPARSKYEETDLSDVSIGYTMRNPFKAIEERIPEFVTKEETFEDDEIEEVHFVRHPVKETWTERNDVKVKSANKPSSPVRRIDLLTSTEIHAHRPYDNKPHGHKNKEENIEDDETKDVRFVRKPAKESWTERNDVKVKSANKPNNPVKRIDLITGTESKTHRPDDNKPHDHKNSSEYIEDGVKKPLEQTWAERNQVKLKSANKLNTPAITTETKYNTHRPDENNPQSHDNKDKNSENNTENDVKVNTLDKVLQFVKVVADTITKNTRRSFNSKLRYLDNLKDTIMINIEDRIELLFPDDRGHGARRRRWARSSEARGHVEFPSSEGALMTISFLTFAVYLIKLVLQVIQSYKNKAMMVPAVVAAVGRAASDTKPTAK